MEQEIKSPERSFDPTGNTNKDKESQHRNETNDISNDRESSIESFHTSKSEISTATELIDVDDIELSDEESWLYKSPKKMSAEEKSISTYKWLHKDVEDMDNEELQVAKTALISKLNQLKILNAVKENKESLSRNTSCDKIQTSEQSPLQFQNSIETVTGTNDFMQPNSQHLSLKKEQCCQILAMESKGKEDLLDVMDVQKIARLQEESLRQSTSRFLSHTGEMKSTLNRSLSPAVHSQSVRLCKPASVEALNTSNGKLVHSSVYAVQPVQGMKKIKSFGSASALNHQNQQLHRGSLPNINKGYYSLRSKKSKRVNDQKMPCPLPMYPSHSKVQVNGTISEPKLSSHVYDHRGSRTLPSSYRVHSKSNSSSHRELNTLTLSPRRESSPFLPSHRSGSISDMNYRDSIPSNPRKFLSPASSPTLHQRIIGPVLQSPTKATNNYRQSLRSPPSAEYHRNASHSPSRRLPLTTVHNYSAKRGNSPVSPRNGEVRTLKMPSKIPSPASRSGIPVPSCISKANSEDDNWSEDCF